MNIYLKFVRLIMENTWLHIYSNSHRTKVRFRLAAGFSLFSGPAAQYNNKLLCREVVNHVSREKGKHRAVEAKKA